jgi:hypothetical protein
MPDVHAIERVVGETSSEREGVNARPTIPGPEKNNSGVPVVIEAHHAAPAAQRSGHIQAAIRVEGQALRAPQPAIVSLHFTGCRRDSMHRIESWMWWVR